MNRKNIKKKLRGFSVAKELNIISDRIKYKAIKTITDDRFKDNIFDIINKEIKPLKDEGDIYDYEVKYIPFPDNIHQFDINVIEHPSVEILNIRLKLKNW